MKCEDAVAFVSALHDGEKIPREVAEHVGACKECADLLAAYSTIGAELRRIASLAEPNGLKERAWDEKRAVQPNWWQKCLESVRIPRFAFALMLVAILLLSGGLVLVRARANTTESVLWLAAKLPPD